MRMNAGWVALCTLGLGCGSKWEFQDQDGDGISAAEGDCWDQSDGPEGSGLSGGDIHPDAAETWYDGFDQNCAGDDDFDADKDGYVPEEYLGLETLGLPETGLLPGGDCWDLIEGPGGVEYGGAEIFPGSEDTWYDGVDQDCDGQRDDYDADKDGFVPDAFVGLLTVGIPSSGDLPGGDCWDAPRNSEPPATMTVVEGETSAGDSVDWSQPGPQDVYPDAEDEWYDGVDANCDEVDDFDKDGDGHRTAHFPIEPGVLAGADCVDRVKDLDGWIDEDYLSVLEEENPDVVAPDAIYPGADDAWYDGVDSDCAQDDDCDADLDNFRSPGPETADCVVGDDELALRPCCPLEGEDVDCDDADPDRKPDPDVEEIPFNGQDDNCNHADGDGDLDGDGWWAWDYEDQVAAYADAHPEEGEITPMEVPDGKAGDCVDDPDDPSLAGFGAANVHPLAFDLEYDGIDAGCEGDDDYDQDADGYVYNHYWGLMTYPVESSGALPGNDCDDRDDSIYDGAPDDWYDGIDSDCAGNVDFDADDDGYVQDVHVGDLTHPWDTDEEDLPDWEDLEALPGGDCEDTEDYSEVFGGAVFTGGDIHPDADDAWYDGVDSDCDDRDDYDQDEDGYVRDEDSGDETYPLSGSGALPDNDCDDERADIHDGAVDIWYDGIDSNCDHLDDYDQDGDGFVRNGDVGDGTYPWSDLGDLPDGDCDDNESTTYPAAPEFCDDVDSDCDLDINDRNSDGCDDYHRDSDADGYGHPTSSRCYCEPEGLYSTLDDTDCSDSDDTIHPDAAEFELSGECTKDSDDDGYSDISSGVWSSGTDCDDGESTTYPAATETCDGVDSDCDGSINDLGSLGCTTWYMDGDRDSYGDASDSQCTCTAVDDYDTTLSTDCDDDRDDTYPGAAESEPALCAKDADDDGYGDNSFGGTWDAGTDCNDLVGSTYPGAPETCDSVDSDCDGGLNDEDSGGCTVFHRDFDDDTYGHLTFSRCYCEDSGHYTALVSGDCDDGNDSVHPDAAESELSGQCTKDSDGDGWGDSSSGGAWTTGTDCDDTEASTYVGADEACDSVDSDCDETLNDRNADGCDDYHRDSDDDGYGHLTTSRCYCSPSGSYSTLDDTDCNDSDEDIHPGEPEICDGVDQDCDTVIDEGVKSTFYLDGDDDGFGDSSETTEACDAPTGYVSGDTDCDDDEDSIYPGAPEVCDEEDNDCDTLIDEGVESTFYADSDGDEYGDPDSTTEACDAPSGYISDDTDCDDDEDSIYPGAPEVCDEEDNDCDTLVDEGVGSTFYADSDGDEYGDPDSTTEACDAPSGYVSDDTDCDDADVDANPGVLFDYADGVDEDCDEYVDEDEIYDLLAADPSADILVISEIQIDPWGGEPGNEWFEVYNATDLTLYLAGWSFTQQRTTGSTEPRTFNVSPGPELSVDPGDYLVFCARNGTATGLGSICDYFYEREFYATPSVCAVAAGGETYSAGFGFRTNTDFEISFGLYNTDCTTAAPSDFLEIDYVDFSAFTVSEGESQELVTDLVTGGSGSILNDLPDNYCSNSEDVYTGSTDMDSSGGLQSNSGTPGAENTCALVGDTG